MEKELIKACKNNNASAQRVFYEKYAPLIKGVCIRYERDRDQVKDLMQDIFIKIFKNIQNYTGEGSFEAWLKKIAINFCIDQIKKKKKKNEISIDDSKEDDFENVDVEVEETNIVSQVIDAGFTKQNLIDLIHTLPANYASVFNMYYIDNLGHQYIANCFSINESLSRKWLFRAKEMIRKQILIQLQQLNKK